MGETEKKEPRSRKKKGMSPAAKRAVIIAAAAFALLGVSGTAGYLYYVNEGKQYQTVFFPNTTVNGLDISYKTVAEAQELVASYIDEYVLTITGRGDVTEAITGEEAGFHHVFDGTLDQYLAAQDPMDWWNHREQPTQYELATVVVPDDEKLAARIDQLSFLDEEQMVEPQDAYLSEFEEGKGYSIIPEVEGTVLDKEAVKKAVTDAVHNGDTELDLESLNVYKEPAVTSEDPELNQKIEEQDHYLNVTVTYEFGSEKEVLDRDTIIQWLRLDEEGRIIIDQEQLTAYVKDLASRYDTVGKTRTLKTTPGEIVTIEKGDYGWKINQKEEVKELNAILESGESQTREPVYSQKAASREEQDYGSTYVEVNLTGQHLYFYKDGELMVESDLVSGNHARGYDTPAGSYMLKYKQKDAVLRGERTAGGGYSYESPVSYWMPFNGGIGLHDASWRGAFGGRIYLTNGSHGCVNLPRSAAKTIFENISAGDPVLCYHTDGSGSGSSGSSGSSGNSGSSGSSGSSGGSGSQAAAPAPAETAPAETAPAETAPAPAETTPDAGNTQPMVPGPGVESQAPAGPGSAESGGGPGAAAGPGASGNSESASGPGAGGPGSAGPGGAESGGSGPGAAVGPEAVGPGALTGPGGESAGPGGPGM